MNFDLSIASKLTGYTPVFLKPDCMFPNVMAWAQAGSKTSQMEPLGKALALVLLFFKLCKWGGVQCLDNMAGVRGYSHDMHIVSLHAVKEGYIVYMTPVRVNDE